MPRVEHSVIVAAPLERVWEFASDMANWAPFVAGYQSHEVKSERASLWTLKGEVGGLSRTVVLDVNVTEWAGPERVSFMLKGVTELLDGGGSFTARPAGPHRSGSNALPVARPPWWVRIRRWVAGHVLSRVLGSRARPREAAGDPASVAAQTSITLALELNAGGTAGPMINMLIAPMLEPVTVQLAESIAEHVEQLGRSGRGQVVPLDTMRPAPARGLQP